VKFTCVLVVGKTAAWCG